MFRAEDIIVDSGRFPTNSQSIEFGPWTISYSISRILPSVCSTKVVCERDDNQFCEFCLYCKELHIPHFPDMVFPKNILTLKHSSGTEISFNPLDALKHVASTMDAIEVACAEAWLETRPDAARKKKPFDWTFSTDYKGTLTDNIVISPTEENINFELLKQRDEILFYHDLTLFEDELHDHGVSKLSAKIRVMPTYWYVLLRYFLRVDDVLVRSHETRMFHMLHSDYVLREYTCKESLAKDLKISFQISSSFELEFVSKLESNNGLGWPRTLRVMEGHDALLKLSRPVVNQESCHITTAQGVTFDISSPPVPNKYERWGDDRCGVRVRGMTQSDEGRWRITAVRGEFNLTGFSDVFVIDSNVTATNEPIHLEDGQVHATVNLTALDNTYCVVTQPFAESTLVPGHCLVTLERTNRAIQGTWGVVLGVEGRVPEYNMQRQVAVEAEHLDVGYIHDSQANKLHLYCNILNTHMDVSFCRFQMTSRPTGYNVLDGLSDGDYSYYGEGFSQKQCGLTVEHPTAADYGSWRCSVGVQELVGSVIYQRSPMQALITVPADTRNSKKVTREIQNLEDSPTRQVFVQNEQQMTLTCRAGVALSYCWFLSPDGEQYSPVTGAETEPFWAAGNGLSMGDCGITFAMATSDFAGLWTCHMGPSQHLGLELTEKIQVRVTGALAAETKEISGTIGEPVTLYCLSAGGNVPLGYCRFLMPNGVGINVDETVTVEQAILGRFYFTPNRSLDHGDCSLSVTSLTAEDVGEWTCAAHVSAAAAEARDVIHLHLYEPAPASHTPASRASVAGIVTGCLVLVVLSAGFIWYKRGLPVPWTRQSTVTSQTPFAVHYRNSASSGSVQSDNSSQGEPSGRRVELQSYS